MPGKLNIPDPCVPGPGSYTLDKDFGYDKRKFTFGPRTLFNDPEYIAKKNGIPGPGFYLDKLALDKVGKYAISTYL